VVELVYTVDSKPTAARLVGSTPTTCTMNKSSYVRKHYAIKKEYCAKIKAERGCKDCLERDPIVLQFHHRDRHDKHDQLIRRGSRVFHHLSWQNLLTEIEKCDVLCANCHLREEYKLASVA
jgi:hypothetical protein